MKHTQPRRTKTGFLILLIFLFGVVWSPVTVSAKPTLESLETEFKKFQAKQDFNGMTRILEQMLANGYKTVERYKQLGDIYFYIKNEKKALDTFRKQAKWANTSKVWENLSDLLLWKLKNKEGRLALEKALSMDPKNEKLLIKMAGVYEYHKLADKALKIWEQLYKNSNHSLEIGQKFVEFYLRNGKTKEGEKLLEELQQKHGEFDDEKMKIIYLRVLIWNNKGKEALNHLLTIDDEALPEDLLEYLFTLTVQGGAMDYSEKIIDRMKEGGKDVWSKQLQVYMAMGAMERLRELINEKISDEGESKELLQLLYESYRSERNVEKEIEVQERAIKLDPQNHTWQQNLIQYYIYHQKYDQGISLFEDLVDDHETLDDLKINLAKLYYISSNLEQFEETLQKVKDPKLEQTVAEMELEYANLTNDDAKQFDALKKVATLLKNKLDAYQVKKQKAAAAEKAKKKKAKKEKEKGLAEEYYQKSTEEEEQEAENASNELYYLDLLAAIAETAIRVEKYDERAKFGRMHYEAVLQYYQQKPDATRLKKVIFSGINYANAEEQEKNLIEGIEKFPEHFFFLHYFRFLMREKRNSEADEILKLLKENSKTLPEQKLTAEHTFGFLKNEKSKELFSNLMLKDPNYITGLKRLGQISLYTKKYESAIFYFEKYLRFSPHDAEILFSMAEAQTNRHYYSEAEEAFERVIELLDHPKRQLYEDELLAISYMRLGEPEIALGIIQKARKVDPKSESLALNEMETLAILEDWQGVLDRIVDENLEKTDPLRVGIIKQQALEELGRGEEGLAVLEELYKKYPKDKELLTVFAYYYSRTGNYHKALGYFGLAKNQPPLYEELNQDYRRLKRRYTSLAGINSTINTATDSQQSKHRVYGELLVGTTDKVGLQVQQYSGKEKTGEQRSTSKTMIDLGYYGDLPGTQRYEAHLITQKSAGLLARYEFQLSFIRSQLTLFYNTPSYDSLGLVLAEAHVNGYQVSLGFQLDRLRQSYLFSYKSRNYSMLDIDENEVATNESVTEAAITQSLFSYPNLLSFYASYTQGKTSGDETFLVVDQEQIEGKVSFSRNWNQYFLTTVEYFQGIEKEASKEYSGWAAAVDFREDDWLFTGYYRSISEKYEEFDPVASAEVGLNAEVNF